MFPKVDVAEVVAATRKVEQRGNKRERRKEKRLLLPRAIADVCRYNASLAARRIVRRKEHRQRDQAARERAPSARPADVKAVDRLATKEPRAMHGGAPGRQMGAVSAPAPLVPVVVVAVTVVPSFERPRTVLGPARAATNASTNLVRACMHCCS